MSIWVFVRYGKVDLYLLLPLRVNVETVERVSCRNACFERFCKSRNGKEWERSKREECCEGAFVLFCVANSICLEQANYQKTEQTQEKQRNINQILETKEVCETSVD